MIVLQVNGKERQLDAPTSLLEFLESLQINLRRIAVAHNGNVLRKGELAKVTLSDGDRLDIVQAVGGG